MIFMLGSIQLNWVSTYSKFLQSVPPLWTVSYKEVNNIKSGIRMWNMMKCFMSELRE